MIFLDGSRLTLDDLLAIADARQPVAPGAGGRARASTRRAPSSIDQALGDAPVYGINTGFGALAETAIPRDALGALQVNLLRSHAAGVGEPLPVRAVRASMALRANVLAKGFSGIRRATLERLLDLLNRRVHPRVPSRGSVGASGDLAPLAHLSLVLIGEGDGIGRRRSGASARARRACGGRARRRSRSVPRKGSRSSTARSRRPRSPRWRSPAPSGSRARPTSPPRCRSTACAARSVRSTPASTTRVRTPDR